MCENKIREKLVLKPVELKHLEQFDELLRYVFQVTNRDIERSGYEKDDELIRAKRPILQNADVIGWFNDDRLVSQLSIYHCEVNVHNKIFKMGCLTGVGTYPEYARIGLMNDLIKVGLTKMRENQQWISYLYPYSIPYYRKKGWEILNEHISYTLKDHQIPHYPETSGFVERLEIDHPDVIDIYQRFAMKNHGALIRYQLNWDEYWRWENEEERIAAIYYDHDGQPMGYVFYWIIKDIFYIKDMVYLTEEARRGLWNFIHAHFSMVDEVKGHIYIHDPLAFQLNDSKITEKIEPYYMARIVDVKAFLSAYPFADSITTPFHFVVSDPIADWNNGIFAVSTNQQGQIEISQQAIGEKIEVSIQILTSLLMGFRRPAYFHKYEMLKIDKKLLRQLERIIPDQQPYFSDYF